MNESKNLTTDEYIEVIKELAPTCQKAQGYASAIEQIEAFGDRSLLKGYITVSFKGLQFLSKDELRNYLTT